MPSFIDHEAKDEKDDTDDEDKEDDDEGDGEEEDNDEGYHREMVIRLGKKRKRNQLLSSPDTGDEDDG